MTELHYKKPDNLDLVMPFGKYKGEKISDVYEKDYNYLKWFFENADYDSKIEAVLLYYVEEV